MGEREKILIADDSYIVHDTVKPLLERNGHEVVAQAFNVEGVREILKSSMEFTLAWVDGKMPRYGDGARAAKLIRERRPGVKIVSMSSDPQTFGDLNLIKSLNSDEILEAIKNLQ